VGGDALAASAGHRDAPHLTGLVALTSEPEFGTVAAGLARDGGLLGCGAEASDSFGFGLACCLDLGAFRGDLAGGLVGWECSEPRRFLAGLVGGGLPAGGLAVGVDELVADRVAAHPLGAVQPGQEGEPFAALALGDGLAGGLGLGHSVVGVGDLRVALDVLGGGVFRPCVEPVGAGWKAAPLASQTVSHRLGVLASDLLIVPGPVVSPLTGSIQALGRGRLICHRRQVVAAVRLGLDGQRHGDLGSHRVGVFFGGMECGVAVIGLVGGVLGTSLGLLSFVAVAASQSWTPVIPAHVIVLAPFLGIATGVVAGAYPAFLVMQITPMAALRS